MDLTKSKSLLGSDFGDINLPSIIGNGSPDDINNEEAQMTSFNLELLKIPEQYSKMVSPSILINYNPCSTIEKEMVEISNVINEIYPTTVICPYAFSDAKVLKNENHAVAVTFEGVFIYINLFTHHFQEEKISDNALSSVILFSEDTFAFVKERDYGTIYCINIEKTEITRILQVQGKGKNGIGRLCLTPDEKYLYARLWKGEIIR